MQYYHVKCGGIFEYVIPLQKRGDQATYALLGNNKALLRVSGYGYINVPLDGHRVRRMAYYVPGLGTTLLSVTDHMQYKGCFFHAEDNIIQLVYPTKMLYPSVTDEIYLSIKAA
eukprot:10024150-Ditylum_brightwellii.AAC.1